MIIFTHIPRTSGTTIRFILRRLYNSGLELYTNPAGEYGKFLQLEQSKRGKFDYISGHFLHGIHQYIPVKCKYFSMLRNPLQRKISYYYLLQRKDNHHYLAEIIKQMGIIEFLESSLSWEFSNGMTRQIAGISLADKVDSYVFELAKLNIKKYYCFVGIQEQFEISLNKLCSTFNWGTIKNYENHSVNTQKKKTISPKEFERLTLISKQIDWADYKLYDYVLNTFL